MIKKLSIISIFGMLSFSALQAQTTVFAYLKDSNGKPVENAEVDLRDSENDVMADKIGYFQFVDMRPGHYRITISKQGFEAKILEFDVTSDEKRKDLGSVVLLRAEDNSELGVITIDDSESQDDDNGGSQPTVGLLSSGRDVFANVAAFELGAYWFRPRGIDNRFEDILFNGVPMSKNDDGKVDFSNWGGLNDVTRYPQENVENITPSEYTFGNLGGVTYYNTRASSYRKGVSLAYSFTNRSYFHRAMATYNSGLTKKGWAFTLSGSRRWADEGVIEGTYQDSYAYFASIEKRLGERHALNLTAFGAPTYRASNSPNTQEVYDLMGKNYNSYWGWQDGEKRNERVRKTFEPIFQLAHYWKIGKVSNLNSTLSYQQGSDARGRLDWFNASSPSPTYYRNLPSFYMSELGGANQETIDDVINKWRTDQSYSQINWKELYERNKNQNERESSASYYTVQDVNDDKTINFNTHFDTMLKSNWKLNFNFNYQNLESDNYRRVNDLLGANYAINVDDYDSRGTGIFGQYNVDDNNIKVYEGDKIEYNYLLKKQSYTGNISTNVNLNRWDITASLMTGYNESQREGKYRHYLYLDSSKGDSQLYTRWDFGLKGRVEYRISGKDFIIYNGAFYSLSPTLNEIFSNPRLNNTITPNIKNQIINSNDLNFIHRGQILKLRLSGYYTDISNSVEVSRFFLDGGTTSAFFTEILNGAEKEYLGGEIGIDVKITPTLNVFAVGSLGQYIYKNNPDIITFSDKFANDPENIFVENSKDYGAAYIKNYKIAGTPQKAASLGFRYNSPKYWWFGMSANYLADNYLDFAPILRTKSFIYNEETNNPYDGATEEAVRAFLKQQKFDNQFMLNANVGKSFLFGKYRMGVSVSVNNILNNREYVTGGYESGRSANFEKFALDAQREISLFAPKLWYDRGRTYFANVYLRF